VENATFHRIRDRILRERKPEVIYPARSHPSARSIISVVVPEPLSLRLVRSVVEEGCW